MMIQAVRKVIKRMHYPLEVMLTCVRWYAAYPLSLRHIEEMMAERGVVVDHATVHRWSVSGKPLASLPHPSCCGRQAHSGKPEGRSAVLAR